MLALRNRNSAFFISIVAAALLAVALFFAAGINETGDAISVVEQPAAVLVAEMSDPALVVTPVPVDASAPVVETAPETATPQVVEASIEDQSTNDTVEIGTACVIEADGTSTGCE